MALDAMRSQEVEVTGRESRPVRDACVVYEAEDDEKAEHPLRLLPAIYW